MRKLTIIFMTLILLSGCASGISEDQLKIETYKTMYTDIFNATVFKTASDYYAVSAALSDLGSGSYRYDVFVDDAKVAMYDVEILLILDDGSLVISDNMMPSIGIFEGKTYYMIPYQVNTEANYVQGFNLNGLASALPVRLKMVVQWKDANNTIFKEYFRFELTLPVS